MSPSQDSEVEWQECDNEQQEMVGPEARFANTEGDVADHRPVTTDHFRGRTLKLSHGAWFSSKVYRVPPFSRHALRSDRPVEAANPYASANSFGVLGSQQRSSSTARA